MRTRKRRRTTRIEIRMMTSRGSLRNMVHWQCAQNAEKA